MHSLTLIFSLSLSHTHTHTHTHSHTHRYLNDSSHHSIIYRGSDLDLSTVTGATCGSAHEDIQQELLKTQMLGGTRHKDYRLRKRQNDRYPNFPDADPRLARCWLNVVGDYKFVQSVGGQGPAMGQLVNIIQQVCTCKKGSMGSTRYIRLKQGDGSTISSGPFW